MEILLIIYIIQTILGYIYWLRILGSKSEKFIQKFTYLLFSLIILPNIVVIIAFAGTKYYYLKNKLKNYCNNKNKDVYLHNKN
jgi:hypothetical protein